MALAELLVGDGRDRHITAERLYETAVRHGVAVSLATVYNTLHAFRDAGLVREVTVEGTKSWFDTRTDDHAHFFWEESGRVTDASAGEVSIGPMPVLPEGTEVAAIDVVIRLRRRR
jgi:Fur family iron response transcriptional regulator